LLASELWSTHREPQTVAPLEQVQLPAWQEAPVAHTVPHAPQLVASELTSTQTPPHGVVPAGQTQAPAEQDAPVGQTLSHAPQLVVVLAKSTQLVRHFVKEPHGRRQLPAAQTSLAAHAFPQLPQLAGSPDVSTHFPSQAVVPGPQTHAPPTQLAPPEHAAPHVPQLVASVAVCTQLPEQSSAPAPHTQAPSTQEVPPLHGVLHAPQCRLSEARATQAPEPQVSQVVSVPPWPAPPAPAEAVPPAPAAPADPGSEAIQARTHASASADSGAPPRGIVAPQGGVGPSFCTRSDSSGFPGTTRGVVSQSAPGTPRTAFSHPGPVRRKPAAGATAPWQPDVAHEGSSTRLCTVATSPAHEVSGGTAGGVEASPLQPVNAG
jgi:hypothetical protein